MCAETQRTHTDTETERQRPMTLVRNFYDLSSLRQALSIDSRACWFSLVCLTCITRSLRSPLHPKHCNYCMMAADTGFFRNSEAPSPIPHVCRTDWCMNHCVASPASLTMFTLNWTWVQSGIFNHALFCDDFIKGPASDVSEYSPQL